MLRHNMNKLLDADTVHIVRIRCGDYTDVIAQLSQDRVFLDPRGEATPTRTGITVDLTFGEWSLSRLCRELRGRCSHVVIKGATQL